MNKKVSLGATLTFILIAAAVTFCLTMVFSASMFDKKVNSINQREAMYQKIADIDATVRNKYVGEINQDQLLQGLAQGYFLGLGDKYGSYLSVEEYKKEITENAGNMVGIGISVYKESSGYLKIYEVQPGSPAESAGLAKGDLLVKIGDEAVTEANADKLQKSLAGEDGTTVMLTFRRDGIDTDTQIVRRQFEIKSVRYEMVDQIAYITIDEFNEKTPAQFKGILDEAMGNNATGIIFDVRDNPGGTITSVTQILDYLLPEGPIVSAVYKDGSTKVLAQSDREEVNLPMSVVVNESTASAAELFAAALSDYDKAKLVGTTTRGKGSMQEIIKLEDGSAVRVTVSRFNPPKSPNFEGVGIKPEFVVEFPKELATVKEDLTIETDVQLKKAAEVLKSLQAQ